jgi:hypothetical protein
MPVYHSSTGGKGPHETPVSKTRVAPPSGPAAGSTIDHLRRLLGDDVVLLPCDKGQKGSRWNKWQDLTIAKMRDEPYLRMLGRAHNIAVLLGKASGGICSIDIDGDESIEPFLKLNPKLTNTLRSRGKRGCNLWVRIDGDFPGTSPLKRQDGSAWGEWRSDRNCTMIHGIHPDGMPYERSPEVAPIEMAFEEIVWPAELVQPWIRNRAKNQPNEPRESGRKLTPDEVRDMLFCIPARPDYEQWLRVSSAVWSALGEDDGTAILRAWSPEEKPGEYDEKFKHRLERVTAGTLVHIARQHGWRGNTPARSETAPAMTPEEAIEKFYYDGNGKYHLDTGVLLVPMDQRSVIRHLKLWGFADTPARDGCSGVEVINPMLCEMQTRRYVRKADEINRFGPDDLRARAYELAFDENTPPPPDELCMNLGEYPIAARGNLTCVQGKSKVGKSAVIAAILGACQRGQYACAGDTLCFEWEGQDQGAIIHLDTEQSSGDWHALVRRSVRRSGLPSASSRLLSIPLVRFARSERITILELVLDREKKEHGCIDAVVIDGVADLCASPNDEAESLQLVSRLHALAQEYSTPIFCVLHENPFGEGKTRGHLGSELNRKAFANLRIEKDAETSVSTMWGLDMRKRDIPQNQGFSFGWDEAAGMHTFQGRAGGIKAAKREEKAITEARQKWEPIFEFITENGTNSTCPVLSPEEAATAIQDMNGTKSKPKADTVKKQMQRAEALGVLRKSERGKWSINPSGQTGHERDK